MGSNGNCPMQVEEVYVSEEDVTCGGLSEGSSSNSKYTPFDEHA